MTFDEYKQKAFQNRPEVKDAYDALHDEYEAISAGYDALGPRYNIIRAEKESRRAIGMSQKELARKMGTAQSNISRFESGNYNPTVDFLQRMASSLGKTLRITLE